MSIMYANPNAGRYHNNITPIINYGTVAHTHTHAHACISIYRFDLIDIACVRPSRVRGDAGGDDDDDNDNAQHVRFVRVSGVRAASILISRMKICRVLVRACVCV